MAFVRKSTLKKLLDINNAMSVDIGKQTTKDYPKPHIDSDKDNDLEYDELWGKSNELINDFNCGNLGEFFGDMSNDNKYANLLSVSNPLDHKHITTFEDFGTMFGFGDWYQLRPGQKVQKFDAPDKELFESKKEIKEPFRIKKFNEF